MNRILHAPAGEQTGAGGSSGASSRKLSGAIRDTARAVGQDVRQVASEFKSAAGDTVSRVKSRAGQFAGDEKNQAAGCVDRYGSALHDSARTFEEQDPNIAHFAHQAADKLQGAAEYIRSKSWGELKSDTEGFGRKHPAAFFGGMFLVGLILGNVLKASAKPSASEDRINDGPGYEPGSGSDEAATMASGAASGDGYAAAT